MENSEKNLLEQSIAQLQEENAALQSCLNELVSTSSGRPLIHITDGPPVVTFATTLEEVMQLRDALQNLIQFHNWNDWSEEGRANMWLSAHILLRALTVDYDQVAGLIRESKESSDGAASCCRVV